MHITGTSVLVASLLVVDVTHASAQSTWQQQRDDARRAIRSAAAEARELYQGRRGPEQSDTFSRKVKVGRDGRVSISNVAGDITVTATAGDDVSIDAVKRTRGDRSELDRIRIVVDEHPGRIDVRTEYDRTFRRGSLEVEYTVAVPAGASLELNTVSGRIKVNGVSGGLRLSSVSGDVTAVATPHVERAKTVSGNIDLSGLSTAGDVSATTVTGTVQVSGAKLRGLELTTVTGEIVLRDVTCEQLNARSTTGGIEYTGVLSKNGRYAVNSHAGSVRVALSGNTGFELDATSFSGSVRSEFPLTLGGTAVSGNDVTIRRGRGSIRGTFGDGSATLELRTFSGSIAILKATNK